MMRMQLVPIIMEPSPVIVTLDLQEMDLFVMVGINTPCVSTLSFSWTDINECFEEPNNCSVNSTCSNTVGSYKCYCFTGYQDEGMGYICTGKCFQWYITVSTKKKLIICRN